MKKPKFQFNVLNLLLLTAIVALTTFLIANSQKHSSQVRFFQQRIQQLEQDADDISRFKEELVANEDRLAVSLSRLGQGHPEVTLCELEVKRLKRELLK